jgi:hypothetical protein
VIPGCRIKQESPEIIASAATTASGRNETIEDFNAAAALPNLVAVASCDPLAAPGMTIDD